MCILFSLVTHMFESVILSSCRTRILYPRRRLKGKYGTVFYVCRLKAFCLKKAIWLWNLCLLLSWFMLCIKASAILESTEIEGFTSN